MQIAEVRAELQYKMDNTLKVLENELKGLRTSRASAHFLDPVIVNAYDSKMPLAQVASVSVSDSRTLSIQVWDKALVKAVEKAVIDANLGVTPSLEGQLIRIVMPVLTQERRQDLVKLARKYLENSKTSLRNIRRDGNEVLKKAEKDGVISKDELHNLSEEVQKITDEFTNKAENLVKQKEQEILTV